MLKLLQNLKKTQKFLFCQKNDIVYSWQKQKIVKNKNQEYIAWDEKLDYENRYLKHKIETEDFRIEYFNLNQGDDQQQVEIDEIFGKEKHEKLPIDSINMTKMYKGSTNEKNKEIHRLKKGFLQEILNPHRIEDQELDQLFDQISHNKKQIYQNKDIKQKEEIFIKENQYLFEQISILLKSTQYTKIPKILLRLSKEISLKQDQLNNPNLYQQLEQIILFNFDVFTNKDLALINFAINQFNKICSLTLRKKLMNHFIKLDFFKLTYQEILIIWASNEHALNDSILHKKILNYFLDNYEHIKKQFDTENKLPLQILCAYTFFHRENRFRKEVSRYDEVSYEKMLIQEKYGKYLYQYFKSYDNDDIFRLSFVIKIMNFQNYDELYYQIEKYLNEKMLTFNIWELSVILKQLQKSNFNKGIFSRKFLSELPEKLQKAGFLNFYHLTAICEYLYVFTSSRNLTIEKFDQIFGKHFLKFLEKRKKFTLKQITLLSRSFSFLNLQDEKSEIIKPFLKTLIYKLSLQKEWIPIPYATQLKQFLLYIKHLHPEWNISLAEHLLYHSNKKMINDISRQNIDLQNYQQIDTVLKKLDTNFLSFKNYHYCFKIDYSIEERKLALFYLNEKQLLYCRDGEQSIINPMVEFLIKILVHDGWTCRLIDFRQFEQLGQDQSEWLKQQIEELYQLTFETSKKIHFEKRLEILQQSFNEMEYLFLDKKYKDMKVYKDRIQKMKESVIKNYKEKEFNSQKQQFQVQ